MTPLTHNSRKGKTIVTESRVLGPKIEGMDCP